MSSHTHCTSHPTLPKLSGLPEIYNQVSHTVVTCSLEEADLCTYILVGNLLSNTLTIQHTQKLKAHRSTEGHRDLYLFLQLCLPLNIDTGSQVPRRPGHTHTHTHTHALTVIAYSTKVSTKSLYLFHCLCTICKDLSAKFCGQ